MGWTRHRTLLGALGFVGVAGVGFLLRPLRLTANPLVGLVAFDAIGGAVLGGIVGRDAVSRRL